LLHQVEDLFELNVKLRCQILIKLYFKPKLIKKWNCCFYRELRRVVLGLPKDEKYFVAKGYFAKWL
jgi:hypothetical protein